MAQYWAENSDGGYSESVDSISELIKYSRAKRFYAQGVDIDLLPFLNLGTFQIVECIIYRSDLNHIVLQSSGNQTGYRHQIVFKDCKVKDFKLIDVTLPTLRFSNCEIADIQINDSKSIIDLEFKGKNNIENIEIINCKGINKIEFSGSNDIKNLIIKDCPITYFIVEDAKLLENIKITNSNISEIKIKSSFLGDFECIENLGLNLLSINASKFNKLFFQEINLYVRVSIEKCTSGILEFSRCNFTGMNLNVTDCSIKLNFQKIQVYKNLIFRIGNSQTTEVKINRSYFSDEVSFLGQFSVKDKNLFITDTVFRDLVLFDDDTAKSLVIKETLFQKGLMLPIPKTNRMTEIDSSVWCILKNQALSRNENINAIEYRKNELTSYTNELKINGTHFQERLVLLFNKISNDHGINWFRGVLFTVITWLLFYSIFVMSKDNFYGLFHRGGTFLLTDSHFWSDAISFLWLPQGVSDLSNGLKEHHPGIFSIIMAISFVFGKIFIAYGAFQTISAFRRHGKA
jgi:hypothetical protein